jgi:hypothetical protein
LISRRPPFHSSNSTFPFFVPQNEKFIEAEGSFIVTITNKKITQRMVLSQKDAEAEISYLSHIMGGYREKDNKGHDR